MSQNWLECQHSLHPKVKSRYIKQWFHYLRRRSQEDKILPFRPFHDDFLVIPLNIMDGVLFQLDQNIEDIWNKILNIIRFVEKKGGILTLCWHQRVFNDREFPGWGKMYERIIQECQKRNAWLGPCQEIYNHMKWKNSNVIIIIY